MLRQRQLATEKPLSLKTIRFVTVKTNAHASYQAAKTNIILTTREFSWRIPSVPPSLLCLTVASSMEG